MKDLAMNRKPKLLISFSGGRTSGYMTKRILDERAHLYDIQVVFANTGLEHPNTLDFVNECDQRFGFNTVWVEADVRHGERKSNGHKIVTYATASRGGEPFEDDVRKYGIPNQQSPHCTRDLKLYPIESYVRSIGWAKDTYHTAIGIRTDESRRVKRDNGRLICYPLIDWFPSDKQDVLDWWSEQPFDLRIQEHQGNCTTCWKKSFKKLILLHQENASSFDFFERLERQHPRTGPEFVKYSDAPDRVFFRSRTSVSALRAMAANSQSAGAFVSNTNLEANGGCSESCELYETE
jgi:hypothetical protein